MQQSQRLRQARKHLKLTQDEFGKAIGKNRASIIKWEKEGEIPDYMFKVIENVHGINPKWLKSGKDKMFSVAQVHSAEHKHTATETRTDLSIECDEVEANPFISFVDDDFVRLTTYELTGAGNEMEQTGYEPVGNIVIPKKAYNPNIVPFYVEGDSMEKIIMKHSTVLVDQTPQKKLYDKHIYCFRVPYAGYIIRRVNAEPDALFLEPTNKEYQSRKIAWDEFESEWVIGRVIGSVFNSYI